MSVLIKGMDMPKGLAERGFVIRGDGRVRTFNGAVIDYATAIPVPPHGDLIERDAAYDKIAEQEGGNYVDMDAVDMGLNETPTIIEAEEGPAKDTNAPGTYDLLYEEGGYSSNGV